MKHLIDLSIGAALLLCAIRGTWDGFFTIATCYLTNLWIKPFEGWNLKEIFNGWDL